MNKIFERTLPWRMQCPANTLPWQISVLATHRKRIWWLFYGVFSGSIGKAAQAFGMALTTAPRVTPSILVSFIKRWRERIAWVIGILLVLYFSRHYLWAGYIIANGPLGGSKIIHTDTTCGHLCEH